MTSVQTRRIGTLEVSVVGLGCNNFGGRIDAAATDRVVRASLDAGVTFFDTAEVYGGGGTSEELLGHCLGTRRDEAVIATKFGMEIPDVVVGGASPERVRTAVEGSLRRLGTDRIDLYQLHTPDPDVPIAETLGALDELVRAGKVVEIGHSNLDGAQIDEAEQAARDGGHARFVCAQNEWSLLARDVEDDVVPAVERNGLALLPYFPLSSGVLTGKYRPDREPDPDWRLAKIPAERRQRFLDDHRLEVVGELAEFAESQGHTILELAFSWLLAHDVVASVIAGATKPEQVQANAAAAGWELTPEDLAEIDRITQAT
jgi:aryl-alcohol dehydrogenase-like predicted oxidoreductase